MESTPEQAAEGCALVRVLASVLCRLVCANAPMAVADPGQVTKFHALKPPGIGINEYLERIHKYASCSNECFILALIYIDRLIQRNNFLLTELNVHRVAITAILLAAKFFDDAYYNNAYYAKVGGVLLSEMNGLEVDFLFRINFTLHVSPELFNKYRDELLSHTKIIQLPPEVTPIAATPQPLPPPPKQLPFNSFPTQQTAVMVTHHHHHHHTAVPHHPSTGSQCHQTSNPNFHRASQMALSDTSSVPSTSFATDHHFTRNLEPTFITPSPPATRMPTTDDMSGLSAAIQQQIPLRCSPVYPPVLHYDHGKTPHGFHGPDVAPYLGPILTLDMDRS